MGTLRLVYMGKGICMKAISMQINAVGVNIYKYIYMYIDINIYTCVHTCININMHRYVYVYMEICLYMGKGICMKVIKIQINAVVYSYIHIFLIQNI
jgi:hypothetical protein